MAAPGTIPLPLGAFARLAYPRTFYRDPDIRFDHEDPLINNFAAGTVVQIVAIQPLPLAPNVPANFAAGALALTAFNAAYTLEHHVTVNNWVYFQEATGVVKVPHRFVRGYNEEVTRKKSYGYGERVVLTKSVPYLEKQTKNPRVLPEGLQIVIANRKALSITSGKESYDSQMNNGCYTQFYIPRGKTNLKFTAVHIIPHSELLPT
ncbi:hypothetical protein BDQ17DRAFT_1420707 [Cyathus striatus]|nr:hypothetical protein BDQ17DRAFT_1420707 [Cyathus striatus]